jgi:hypothetical protein
VMDGMNRIHADQRGWVGKFLVVWLLLLALIVVVAADAISIGITTFKLSDDAQQASSDALVVYRQGNSTTQACETAAATIASSDPKVKLTKNFCTIDPTSREVTITLRTEAHTFLLGRLSFTRHYANVTEAATAGESAV